MPEKQPSDKNIILSDALLDQALAWFEEMGEEVEDLLDVHPHDFDDRQTGILHRSLRFSLAIQVLTKAREIQDRALSDTGSDILNANEDRVKHDHDSPP